MVEITKSFPYLVVEDRNGLQCSGFLKIDDQHFQVTFTAPNGFDDLTGFEMDCDNQMASLLCQKKALVEQRLKKAGDLLEFIVELKVILEKELKTRTSSSSITLTDFHSLLMNQIMDIGWEKIGHISTSLHTIELIAKDSNARNHVFTLTLSDRFPNDEPQCSALLPAEFNFDWSTDRTLRSLHQQFTDELEKYQLFWDVMDEIDTKTWVLEPEKPTRADKRRRIAVASSASILLLFNPAQPRSMPEFTFMGPEKVTEPLKEKLISKDPGTWNTNMSVLENIQQFLEVELPVRHLSKEEEYKVECGICYSHLLDTSVPDCACENDACGQLYHQVCIYEWLRALPDTRQSFNYMFGECPYCSKAVSAKVPSG